MDIEKLFQELEEVIWQGEKRGWHTAWNSELLGEFEDYIKESYGENRPMWAEVFYQIYTWQFVEMYKGAEGLIGYYENEYGNTSYKTIVAVAQYLKENRYCDIYKYYIAPFVEVAQYLKQNGYAKLYEYCIAFAVEGYKLNEYPKEMYPILGKTEQWIEAEDGERAVWNFYVDILTKNKAALIAVQKEKQK